MKRGVVKINWFEERLRWRHLNKISTRHIEGAVAADAENRCRPP
jgi:hypothetical protein